MFPRLLPLALSLLSAASASSRLGDPVGFSIANDLVDDNMWWKRNGQIPHLDDRPQAHTAWAGSVLGSFARTLASRIDGSGGGRGGARARGSLRANLLRGMAGQAGQQLRPHFSHVGAFSMSPQAPPGSELPRPFGGILMGSVASVVERIPELLADAFGRKSIVTQPPRVPGLELNSVTDDADADAQEHPVKLDRAAMLTRIRKALRARLRAARSKVADEGPIWYRNGINIGLRLAPPPAAIAALAGEPVAASEEGVPDVHSAWLHSAEKKIWTYSMRLPAVEAHSVALHTRGKNQLVISGKRTYRRPFSSMVTERVEHELPTPYDDVDGKTVRAHFHQGALTIIIPDAPAPALASAFAAAAARDMPATATATATATLARTSPLVSPLATASPSTAKLLSGVIEQIINLGGSGTGDAAQSVMSHFRQAVQLPDAAAPHPATSHSL